MPDPTFRIAYYLNNIVKIIHSAAPDFLMNNPTELVYSSLGVVYGDVKQRWIVIYSPEARQRALKSVNKHCLKQSTAEFKAFDTLCKQDFACEADVRGSIGFNVHQSRVESAVNLPNPMRITSGSV